MAAPVLLVADDLSTIASVRRLLGREGYEVILATSAADAVIAFGHHLPGLIVLDPRVESDRGQVVLEELQVHPDGGLVRVLLLGQSVPGFAWPMVPLPPEADTFLPVLGEAMRGGTGNEGWTVPDKKPSASPVPPPPRVEPEAWRATAPAPSPRPPRSSPAPAASPDVSFQPVPEASAALGTTLQPFQDGPHPEDVRPPEGQGPPLERAIAHAAAARLQARETALAREASVAELHQTVQRLLEERDLERAENQKTLQLVERLRAELADEKGRGGEARVAAEREHYLGVLAEKDRALEEAELEVEAAREQAMRRGQAEEQKVAKLEQMARAMEGELERVRKERDALRADSGKGTELAGRLAAADKALEAADATLRAEQERAQTALGRMSDEKAALQEQVAQLEGALSELRARFDGEVARRGELEATLANTLQRAEELETRAFELETRWKEAEVESGRSGEDRARALEENAALAAERARLAGERSQLAAERDGALGERDRLAAERDAVAAERDRLSAERDAAAAARDAATAQRDAAVTQRDAAVTQRAAAVAQRDAAVEQRDAAVEQRDAAVPERDAAVAQRDAAVAQRDAAVTQRDAAVAQRDAAVAQRDAGLARLAEHDAQLAAAREDAGRAEARATAAEAQAQALEERIALPVRVAGRAPLMLPRAANVDRQHLAELVCQLVLGRNEVRLELGTRDGLRTLWLSRGSLLGAESQVAGESMIERARRDGLIDARQEAELRMMRPGSPREVLDVLKARGFLRQAEVLPLLQRYVEQVALDALSEPEVGYRVSEEVVGPEVPRLESPRPALPLLAEALRRGVPPDALLELLGGGEAIPVSKESSLDLRALGFTEKERRLLGYVDGQATVEELSMVAGVRPEAAFRALLVARYLGLVEVRAPAPASAPLDPELDVKRLAAKFEEVQEADYFTILGLARSAGTDEVQRSFERLSREFDPIRFSGHPDARLQQQAQIVYRLLEEAARALEDDRRRLEYARHLLD